MFDFEVPNIDRESSFSFWATTGPEIRKKSELRGALKIHPQWRGAMEKQILSLRKPRKIQQLEKKLLDPKCI